MRSRCLHPVFVLLAAGALAAGGRALAVTPPNPGPDVTVGDIPDCTNYGSWDLISYTYDLGTDSCNIGNVNLRWQGGTAKHPVIAQNVYRFRPPGSPGLTSGGRFEQIGMSWVKHGFYALSQNLCGTCSGQGGNVLGVGCSDPYEGGVNGDQGGLGPRSEINASTGVFPFVTPHGWPAMPDGSARRVRILGSDVVPPNSTGATYYGEALYISPDDSPAGNNWNNAGWRPLTIALDTVNHTMAVTGTSRRGEPAIFAWKSADPTVRLAGCDVPVDGRYWLGHTATNNGNGTWHYEYALMNLTSDRSGASFTVPIPNGTAVTNAAVRIIPYHSGEVYSSAAWTVITAADSVTFSVPQTYAQNPNASALRWGTLYNFRFDASAAPSTDDGVVTVGLFKPGTPASFSLAAKTPGAAKGPALATPVSDECAGATVLHAGENRTSNLGATDSTPAACTPLAADVWFTYTFNSYTLPFGCPGLITFDTCGSEVPTSIAVYAASNGACPGGPGSETACAAQGSAGTCTGSAAAATVSVPAVEGATYRVRVGSPTGTKGNLVVNVVPPFCVPPNGACCAPNGSCQIVTGASSCFTGTFLAGSTTCGVNPCPLPPPPANDQCAGAIVIGDYALGYPAIEGTNFLADNTVNDLCDFSSTGSHDVWYKYTPAMSATVTIDTCIVPASGVPLDTLISIHATTCTTPVLACNDDDTSGLCGNASRMTPALTAGTTYYIRVSGYGPATGDFVLRVNGGGGIVPPQNGACCWGAVCSLTVAADCTGAYKSFRGVGTVCNGVGNNVSPCCRADFNKSGALSVQDVFDFLNEWFAGSHGAAFGGDGSRAPIVQDIFDFLNAWFAGC